MKCTRCNDLGVVLKEGRKNRFDFCDCAAGKLRERGPIPVVAKPIPGAREQKYGAKPSERVIEQRVVKFASKREAARYDELALMVKAGAITELKLHPVYPLVKNDIEIRTMAGTIAKYTADFEYLCDGELITEDVKSSATMTEASRLRISVFQSLYGRKVRITT